MSNEVKKMGIDQKLSEIFEDIRKEWRLHLSNQLNLSDDEDNILLKLPEDYKNKMIYFDVPFNNYFFYRETVFSQIRNLGYIPILEKDIRLETEEFNLSKLYFLIEKADIIVIDVDTSIIKKYIESYSKSKNIIYIIEHKLVDNLTENEIVYRPKDLEKSTIGIEKFINSLIHKIEIYSIEHPFRYDFIEYFRKKFFSAAVVFAFKELELKLRDIIDYDKFHQWNFNKIIKKYIPHNYYIDLNEYRRIRNRIVHEHFEIDEKTAESIIKLIEEILKYIENEEYKTVDKQSQKIKEFFKANETPESIQKLFYALKPKVEQINDNIWLKVAKTAMTYYDERVFLYIVPQKSALLLMVPLHHNESDLLEIRAGGKSWPGMKLRRIEEINDFLPIISKAHKNRYNWRPYNEEQYAEYVNSE